MRFSIYSTDNIDPKLATDATFFDLDTKKGAWDPRFEWEARGANTPTLGGRIDQDYGFNIKDRKIKIGGEDMLEEVRVPLEIKHQKKDQDWNFTDGLEVFRVRFSRKPRGFITTLDAELFGQGLEISDPPPLAYVRYKYEILLLVDSQLK